MKQEAHGPQRSPELTAVSQSVPSACQVSSQWLKQFSRYLGDKVKTLKTLKGMSKKQNKKKKKKQKKEKREKKIRSFFVSKVYCVIL